MPVQVTLSLEDELAAELQRAADRRGRSLEETVIELLRTSVESHPKAPVKPLEIRAKALHAYPGIDFDDIPRRLEQAEQDGARLVTPIVESLRGGLADSGLDDGDYRRHLVEKHEKHR